MIRFFIVIVLSLYSAMGALTQQVYFADGYHGGIYGHYPLWKTKFIVDEFFEHPVWKIGLEIEPETWDTVKLQTPEDYSLLQTIISDKRIEITNPAYAQPYCYNTSGESLIRQFEYGIRKTRAHFPDVQFTSYAVEEPCFTSCLPQILKLFGIKYAVLKNPNTCWGGYTSAYGGELVNWIGPDGTSILTVPRYACEELEENSTWQTKAWNNPRSFLDACFSQGIQNPVGMCYQDAGWRGGPWLGHGDSIKHDSRYVTWTDYIEHISTGKTDDDWHFSQEDVLVSLMWGSQALQRIAQQVRRGENDIVTAEKMGVISNLENGMLYAQEEIDEAWRTLMMAQHHDSWIVPYNRLFRQHTWAQQIEMWTGITSGIAGKIISSAVQSFGTASNPRYIRVYNTLGVSRNEIIQITLGREFAQMNPEVYDSDNKKIPSWIITENDETQLFFKADVKPFGYATYLFLANDSRPKVEERVRFESDVCIMENDMYRMVLDASKGGIITHLIAKKEGNRDFAVQNGQYALGELRGYFYEEARFHSSTETPAILTVMEDHPFRIAVKIEGMIADHPFTQIVTISDGQRRIDFDLTIDWKENVGIGEYQQLKDDWRENPRRAFYDDRFKLNVLFPVDLASPQLYKNAPFDVCESRHGNTFFNSWDKIKHNIILNWVDLVQQDGKYGLSLLSDHTTSYSFGEDFPLGLTAQYAGIGLWGVDYTITQPTTMRFAIIPHNGRWDDALIATESNCWNEPLIYSLHHDIEQQEKSLIETENATYEITAAKMDGNDIIVRLFNAAGDKTPQTITFNFPFIRIDEIDLNGNIMEENITGTPERQSIAVSMPRFGIKTYQIKRYQSLSLYK